MSLKKSVDPQISQIFADGLTPLACPAHHPSGLSASRSNPMTSRVLICENLRHLRKIE
ncbi:hypothetical protein [Sulfuritalea hydrogenivorans]|uniref:hypothetical protein n=1 Tax=Sulfuritalea hydrogenivorans TaxID=748811 RepID=UPI001494CA26|nr:hypothetical protein [Sulfuritalea hydrogenivorans]